MLRRILLQGIDMGKGSWYRPVNKKKFDQNFDKINWQGSRNGKNRQKKASRGAT